jgi:hypothetical protein
MSDATAEGSGPRMTNLSGARQRPDRPRAQDADLNPQQELP